MTARDDDRLARVMAAVRALARAEGRPVAVRHVCQACASMVRAGGVGLYLIGDLWAGEPIYATDVVSERIMDMQVTVGEGPGVQALDGLSPVLAPELTGIPSQRRWPLFAPAAVKAGASAMFAFPLVQHAIPVGVLEVHRVVEGDLSGDEITDALLFAEVAVSLLADLVEPDSDDVEEFACSVGARWGEIHRAIGVVSIQLESGLTEAFLRLRARAFAADRPLSEIAEDVLTQRMRFTP
ncbi:ANTAR domain-containing protein [Kutzneria sp. CA-103260]|uniref:ANTAR domain-containing protein n=1 Tax=Kutzneria sp. CA-103260 TaxID=2802641 RepID=UPI001BACE6DA|nr:ANTAR domain-containing protein [Kutzneria sp. CA-103260]QUQ68714.1 ANTAR domain-containing protein [Kutzneria sp. CA-103260]